MPTLSKPAPNTSLETFRDLLERVRPQMAAVLPKHLSADRLAQLAMSALARDRKLMQCTPVSVARAVMIAAELGLDPAGALGEAYLIPRWNSKQSKYEATFQIGYRGLVKLAHRHPMVAGIEAHTVFKADHFIVQLGTKREIDHRPSFTDDPGEPVAAYCVIDLRDAPHPQVEVMSRSQIERVRDVASEAWKRANGNIEQAGPWGMWPEEMWRKTVAKRALKYAPVSTELATAVAIEDAAAQGDDVAAGILQLPDLSNGEAAAPDAAPEGTTSKADALARQLKAQERGKRAAPKQADVAPAHEEPPHEEPPADGGLFPEP